MQMDKTSWLTKLIAIDTTSYKSNLDLIELVSDWCKAYQLDCRLTYDHEHKKANLFVTIPGKESDKLNGLILSGHTDVVPVDQQIWKTDPFTAVQRDDKIYGRGTTDMKGFLAVILALVPHWTKAPLKRPLHLAFSYDEEVGCKGAPLIIQDFLAAGFQPAACIVGEPSLMRPVVGHKGIQAYRCQVTGLAAHSSLLPKGCNAIEYAAEAVTFIRRLAQQLRQNSKQDHHYDVPYSTITTNLIKGGIALNIIPAECEFKFEFRHLPQVLPAEIIGQVSNYIKDELLPMMKSDKAESDIQLEHLAGAPGFENNEDSNFVHLVRELTGDNSIHKVAYATEAGLFQHANISTVICGPGSIEQAHCPDEFVTIQELDKCEVFLRQLVERF